MELLYEFQLVGGSFDGAPGLKWIDDGDHEPPVAIFVGRCVGDRSCGMSACRRGKRHVAFWTEEEDRPTSCRRYVKQEEFVRRDDAGELRGTVIYAIGGLLNPQNFGERARVPVGEESRVTARIPPLTFAGASRWGFLSW